MPTKSRMAGSLVHARRRAARGNSAGKLDCRNATMSVSAVIVSIDGKRTESNGWCSAASPSARGIADSMPVEATSEPGTFFASCLSRAQRRKTFLVSTTVRSLYSTRKGLAIALALDERTIDMMFGYKPPDDFGKLAWHGHLIDQIVARLSKSFTFRRISGNSRQFI